MTNKKDPKFVIGETVRTSKEDYGVLTIKDRRWSGYTWMYSFEETDARMGEIYLSNAPLNPSPIKDSWNREEVMEILEKFRAFLDAKRHVEPWTSFKF